MDGKPTTVGRLTDLPERERVRSGGVELALRRLVPDTGEAGGEGSRLVALHGGPGLDHHVLLPLASSLARRLEVWAVDLPGHGGSVNPSGKLPGLTTLEMRLGAWLGHLSGGFDILLGHSLGAWLASRLLRRGRVAPRAAVLVAPPAAGQDRSATALRRAVRAIGAGATGDPAHRASRARRELRAHVEAETRSAASAAFLQAIERVDVRDPRDYGPLLRNFHRAVTGPVRAFDPGCPVLVLCGEEDRTTPPDQARRVAESIAGARLELVEGAGHYPFAERPDEVTDRIVRFLSALDNQNRSQGKD